MKLSNIESKKLLPRFASDIAWVMDALDELIRETAQRVKSIDAPLTMEAIEACTDAELEALYDQYGVAKYYPDLSRETRNKMLFEMCRIYRYLGTPKAIEVLCDYIFDGVSLDLTALDNLAFDDSGDLVDPDLLDVFDIEISPTDPVVDETINARILANVIRFSRNSQSLRRIIYDFPQDFVVVVSPCEKSDNPQVIQDWQQNALCEPIGYTLSFVNTQLPDITITMPPSETGPSGTVVTLPTMSGEYESGGKTWTPSAWDIGAFGSSYTITADAIAHLVFDEVADPYEEITLYTNQTLIAQANVTSSFNDDVNSTYVYNLYTDSGTTTLWNGFSYDCTYEIGYYSSGNWVKRIYSIADMPDTTVSSGNKFGFILMDNNKLWLVTNKTSSIGYSISSIYIRVRKKEQQYYAGYFTHSSAYRNLQLYPSTSYQVYPSPTSDDYAYPITKAFPPRSIYAFYGAGGNLVSSGTTSINWDRSKTSMYAVYNGTSYGILKTHSVLYTLPIPTFFAWKNLSGDTNVNHFVNSVLLQKDGSYAVADQYFRYSLIGMFYYSGTCHSLDTVNGTKIGALSTTYKTRLYINQTATTQISLSYVWYTKEYLGKPIELTLWYSSSWGASAFSANNSKNAFIKDQTMEDRANHFGMATDKNSSNVRRLLKSNIIGYDYEITGLYDSSDVPVTTNLGNFYVSSRSGAESLQIKSISAFATVTAQWRVKVWRYLPYIGYFTLNGASETADTTLSTGHNDLYDDSGNAISYDSDVYYRYKLLLTYSTDLVSQLEMPPTGVSLENHSGILSLYVDSSVTTPPAAYRVIFSHVNKNEFWLDGVFGTDVEIPVGFTVDYIKCDRGYLPIDSIYVDNTYGDNDLRVTVNGENEYFTDTDTSLLALGASPYISVFIFTSDTGGNILTYGSSYTPGSYQPSGLYYKKLNTDGVCVSMLARFTTAGRAQDYYDQNAGTRLIQLIKYDQYDEIVPYHFKIQSSLWEIQNGFVHWLGDTTDPADPANHYNGKNVLIHCVRVQS